MFISTTSIWSILDKASPKITHVVPYSVTPVACGGVLHVWIARLSYRAVMQSFVWIITLNRALDPRWSTEPLCVSLHAHYWAHYCPPLPGQGGGEGGFFSSVNLLGGWRVCVLPGVERQARLIELNPLLLEFIFKKSYDTLQRFFNHRHCNGLWIWLFLLSREEFPDMPVCKSRWMLFAN